MSVKKIDQKSDIRIHTFRSVFNVAVYRNARGGGGWGVGGGGLGVGRVLPIENVENGGRYVRKHVVGT